MQATPCVSEARVAFDTCIPIWHNRGGGFGEVCAAKLLILVVGAIRAIGGKMRALRTTRLESLGTATMSADMGSAKGEGVAGTDATSDAGTDVQGGG